MSSSVHLPPLPAGMTCWWSADSWTWKSRWLRSWPNWAQTKVGRYPFRTSQGATSSWFKKSGRRKWTFPWSQASAAKGSWGIESHPGPQAVTTAWVGGTTLLCPCYIMSEWPPHPPTPLTWPFSPGHSFSTVASCLLTFSYSVQFSHFLTVMMPLNSSGEPVVYLGSVIPELVRQRQEDCKFEPNLFGWHSKTLFGGGWKIDSAKPWERLTALVVPGAIEDFIAYFKRCLGLFFSINNFPFHEHYNFF